MNKQMARRITSLEQQLISKHPVQLVWVAPVEEDRRQALAPGERIVLDEYGQCGGVILARERITTDPLDNGQPCPLKEDA